MICKLGGAKLNSDVRFELPDPENGTLPLYSPFVRLSENADFGSNFGTHSESSRRSWKLRFFFLARFRHARSDGVATSPQFLFVKQIFLSRALPPKTHKSYRSSGRDQTCTQALVDLYNILEYQKDRPNGCTQRCVYLSVYYGRPCKIRISRRTPDFQDSSLLVPPQILP